MSEMRKITVEELKPGMKFDKPVYIDSNNMLVGANIAIKEDDIKKLMRWGIHEIETAGDMISSDKEIESAKKTSSQGAADAKVVLEEYNRLLEERANLIKVYKLACQEVEKVHEAIKGNKNFPMDGLNSALKEIMELMQRSSNIFLFLYGLDEGKNFLVAHSVNVTFYALLIGMALKFNQNKLRKLGMGTLLIDSGMLKMPTYIINKQSNLTEQEYNMIKTHPLHGYRILKQLGKIEDDVAIVTLQHHEQYDGRGYPRGLKGNQIDEFGRIAAIADSYESQISNRSYRSKQFFYHAMRNMLSTGVSRFDPVMMRVFLSRMSVYPIGSIVELNDGSIGLVVGSVPQKPLRPIVKVIFDDKKKRIEKTIMINLLEKTSLYIVKALNEEEAGVNFLEVL